jgi:hypothetical protein
MADLKGSPALFDTRCFGPAAGEYWVLDQNPDRGIARPDPARPPPLVDEEACFGILSRAGLARVRRPI